MPTLKQLTQRHPSVDSFELGNLRALYAGGKEFKARVTTFLPQRPHEPPSFYTTRCKEAVYRNYVAPTIDYFNALLFSSRPRAELKTEEGAPVEIDEYYNHFREDADHAGSDVDAVFKAALTDAMVCRCSWIRLRHPVGKQKPDEAESKSRADFERSGIGDAWISQLSADDVLDWEVDSDGNLTWALQYSRKASRDSLTDDRRVIVERWEHLLPDRVDVYETKYRDGERPSADDSIPLVSSSPHRFGAVPLVPLDLPIGLWVLSRLETPQLAHFRLTNAQQWGLFATCYAQPLFKLKDNDHPPTMGAGYGIVIGAEEDMEWVAPPSTPYEALGNAISEHKDEIFRIAQNMALGVENNAAAIGRTAESKAADAQATRVVLLAYSRIVKEAIERVYDLISRLRGDDYEWSIEGLDDFAATDIGALVDVLEKVEKAGGIPSPTFNVAMKSRVAESLLPDMDQATKAKVAEEITAGIAKAETDAEDDRQAELKRKAQPPPVFGNKDGAIPNPNPNPDE